MYVREFDNCVTLLDISNVFLMNDVFIIDKNYLFRPTVAIIRSYPKLYAKKSVYTNCATAWL